MLQDIRSALRVALRRRSFALGVVLSVALTTGLTTSIYTVVHGVVFRPLPFPNPERLVRLFESDVRKGELSGNVSGPNFFDWRQSSRTVHAMTAIASTSYTLTAAGYPEQVSAMLVSRDFFSLLGRPLALGRMFEQADFESSANAALGVIRRDSPTMAATMILSHHLWQRQFAGNPDVVGRRVSLDGHQATVIGVMGAGFGMDDALGGKADCWLPLVETGLARRARQLRYLAVVGRLASGRDAIAAQNEFDLIASRLANEYPRSNAGWGVRITALHDSLVGDARRTLLVLLGASGCLFLIGCANIANLLLVRTLGRSREFAVRLALGATRRRVRALLLMENLVLSLIGGCGGFAVASLMVPVLVRYAPPNLPRPDSIAVDAHVFGFSVLASALAGIVCTLAAGFSVTRADACKAIRLASTTSPSTQQRRLRQVLVVTGVGLTVVLLAGAGLMLRSLLALRSVDVGFDRSNLLTFGVDPRLDYLRQPDKYDAFRRDLVERLAALPGVDAAGVGTVPLVGGLNSRFGTDAEGTSITATVDAASPGYFRALGIRLLWGRPFDDHDDGRGPQVAIVSRSFARSAWAVEQAVGRLIHIYDHPEAPINVIGVVDDVRMSGPEAPVSHVVYLPYLQSRTVLSGDYVVRAASDPNGLVPLIRHAVASLGPDLAVTRLATMEARLAHVVAPRLFNLWLVGLFSFASLGVALVGVHGFVAQSLASRQFEFGLRLALGAQPADVAWLVAREGLTVLAAGLVVGVGTALVLNRLTSSLLFGVRTTDPLTYASAAAVCAIAIAAACIVPLKRAWRSDAVVALRVE